MSYQSVINIRIFKYVCKIGDKLKGYKYRYKYKYQDKNPITISEQDLCGKQKVLEEGERGLIQIQIHIKRIQIHSQIQGQNTIGNTSKISGSLNKIYV